jgi:hypothetical protein
MVCWHSRYNLGDSHNHSNPDEFLAALILENIPEKDLIDYVKDGKASYLTLEYNASSREWDLSDYSDYYKKWFNAGSFAAPLEKESSELCEAIVDNMSPSDLMKLAEKDHILIPLYLLDHSGITMSTKDFNDRWDSGQVGWAYASNKAIAEEYGDTSPENIEKARALLESEVDTYDCYLRGECYGFELYEGGELKDSCWGFLGHFDEALKSIREYLPEEAVPLIDSAEYGDDETEYEPEDEDEETL